MIPIHNGFVYLLLKKMYTYVEICIKMNKFRIIFIMRNILKNLYDRSIINIKEATPFISQILLKKAVTQYILKSPI